MPVSITDCLSVISLVIRSRLCRSGRLCFGTSRTISINPWNQANMPSYLRLPAGQQPPHLPKRWVACSKDLVGRDIKPLVSPIIRKSLFYLTLLYIRHTLRITILFLNLFSALETQPTYPQLLHYIHGTVRRPHRCFLPRGGPRHHEEDLDTRTNTPSINTTSAASGSGF